MTRKELNVCRSQDIEPQIIAASQQDIELGVEMVKHKHAGEGATKLNWQ